MSLLEQIRVGRCMRPLAFNQDVKALVARPELINASYLTYAILASRPQLLGWVHQAGHGTGVLATDRLTSLTFRLPPLSEQRAIAGVLGALDDLIDTNKRLNVSLEGLAQAKFDLMFGGLGLLPGDGEASRPFLDSVEVVGGGTPPTNREHFWGGDIPWFSVVDAPDPSDIWVFDTEKSITEAGLAGSSTRLLDIGTTIISARGTVGRLALVGTPMAMNQSCYGLKSRDEAPYFTYFSTRAIAARLQRMAHGSVFSTITKETLAGVEVPRPARREILDFEYSVAPLMEQVLANSRNSEVLRRTRDELLPLLMSGAVSPGEVAG